MAVFKTPSILDRQVESCHIKLEANATKLCFILKYKNNIVKTHLLPIIDCETINVSCFILYYAIFCFILIHNYVYG